MAFAPTAFLVRFKLIASAIATLNTAII